MRISAWHCSRCDGLALSARGRRRGRRLSDCGVHVTCRHDVRRRRSSRLRGSLLRSGRVTSCCIAAAFGCRGGGSRCWRARARGRRWPRHGRPRSSRRPGPRHGRARRSAGTHGPRRAHRARGHGRLHERRLGVRSEARHGHAAARAARRRGRHCCWRKLARGCCSGRSGRLCAAGILLRVLVKAGRLSQHRQLDGLSSNCGR
jgi:hypothetical protein